MSSTLRRCAAFAVAAVMFVPHLSPGSTSRSATMDEGTATVQSESPVATPELNPFESMLAFALPQLAVRDNVRRNQPPMPFVRPTMPPLPARPTPKAALTPPLRATHGISVLGPMVSHPWLNERSARRAVRSVVDEFRRTHASPTPPAGLPGTTRGVGSIVRRQSAVDVTQPNVTGINRWWSYREGVIPGIGRYIVNAWQQNLMIQVDDMGVKNRGIDLAFRRTYNSYSGHDYIGTDGSVLIGQFGNGWTNTFDAHMSQNSAGGMSVYDIDGARYDYAYDANGNLIPPPGMEGTSLATYDGASFYWTKKNGTQYTFYAPYYSGSTAAYSGRMYRISARNRNSYVQFSYSWDNGDASASSHLNQVSATTDSGRQVTLQFADFNGRRLCSFIEFPDNRTFVWYGYDADGNLNTVRRMPNSNGGPYRYEIYGGYGNNFVWASNPRWNQSGGQEGGYVAFHFTSATPGQLDGISSVGVMNFVPPDGTGTPLQSNAPTSWMQYLGQSVGRGAGYTAFADSDGHSEYQYTDSSGRPSYRYQYTGSPTSLQSFEAWDAHNNRVADIDVRNNETDYAYDVNDNVIAVGEPLTTTSEGTFRPTRLVDYDAFSNVLAYCDEHSTHQAGADWVAPPTSGGQCSSRAATIPHAQFVWVNPPYQSYGELSSLTTPMGYTRRFEYAAPQEGGADYGLPTSITGDPITQVDGTVITPTQTLWYDSVGNIRCNSNGVGTAVMMYNLLSQIVMVADPDDSSANAGSLCGKAGGQAGWNTQATRSFNPDGSLQASQGPAERAGGVWTTFTYDADGNQASETQHHSCVSGAACTPGVTNKWYDGDDRLVEVALPQDPSDWYSSRWLTRYLYDLNLGNLSSFSGATFRAYGNLFVTQEWAPDLGSNSASWIGQRASAFDALDRVVTKYSFSPSSGNPILRSTSMSYDTSVSTLGLLASSTDPLGETISYGYDSRGHTVSVQFSGDSGVTPNKAFAFDANGRQTSATGARYGAETRRYDADGHLIEMDEPIGHGISSPARLTYDYYRNGSPKDVNVSSAALNARPLLSYSYRADGRRTKLHVGYGQQQGDFAWTYSDGGRMMSRSDPFTGTVMPNPQAPVAPGTRFGPTTASYDVFGQMNQVQLPETLAYSVQRDFEGNVASSTASSTVTGPVTMHFELTERGENVGQWNSPSAPLRTSHIANGAVITPVTAAKGPDPAWRAVIDPRNSVVAATSREIWLKWNDATSDPSSGTADCGRLTTASDYDAAGRLVGTTTSQTGSADPHCDVSAGSQSNVNYSYDAENHHVGSTGASWSPNGRAYNLQGTTVHYAGAMPIFGTDSQGVLVGVKVETLADIDASGQLTVWDRDYSGLLQTGHNNSAYYDVNLGNVMVAGQASSGVFKGSTGNTGWTAFLPYRRLEGFDYGGLTFQGARAVEAASGQWTTPDTSQGNVHDPTSQKPFMWDRNNAYEYSDPSGFTPNRLADCGCSGGGYESIDAAKERAKAEAENRAINELAQEFFFEWPLIEMLRAWMRVGGESLPQDVIDKFAKVDPKFEEGRNAPHYADHFQEFGRNISAADYLKAARDFLNEAKNGRFQTKWDPDERTLRFYDEKTNRFGSFRLDGIIRTFFKPRGQTGQDVFDKSRGVKLNPLAGFDA